MWIVKRAWKTAWISRLLLLTGVLLAGSVADTLAAQIEKVNFWAVRDPQNSSQLALANRLGYFKEAGLEVQINWVTSFSDLYAHAGAEQIDFTVSSVNNGLRWNNDNIPMKYMAILTNIAGGQGVAINPSVVKKPADFEKIKIGMATGSTVEIAIRSFAKAHHIEFSKLQFVNLQPPDQLSAFSSGEIQAMAFWQPWLHRGVNEFGAKLYFTGTQSFIPGHEGQGIVVEPTQRCAGQYEAAKGAAAGG
jgi:NitT/TauT family transport system substrate-binding protein